MSVKSKNIHVLPTEKPSRIYTCGNALYMNKVALEHNTNQNIYITSDEEIKDSYAFHLKTQEVLKVKGVGEKSKEIFHSKGFNCQNDCKKIILTTDKDLIEDGIQAIDDEFLEWFVKNPSCEEVEVEYLIDETNGELVPYKIIIPKEEATLANMRCTCMNFEPNCFTGSCRKCGFLPKEEPKQETLERKIGFIPDGNWNPEEEVQLSDYNKQETFEEVRKVERTELFNYIFSVVKQIPRKDIDGDAMDAPSCAYEIEQLFYEWQQEQDKKMYSEEEVRKISLEFFYHWWNTKGSNTEQGFDKWFNEIKK